MARKKIWDLKSLAEHVVAEVVSSGKLVHEVLREMWPIALDGDSQDQALFQGLRAIINDGLGMSALRSGKFQPARGRVRPVEGEDAGLVSYAAKLLARLVFMTADGGMASVLNFSELDAKAALARRVIAPRAQANREEPFWTQLVAATAKHGTLRDAPDHLRQRMAQLAVSSELTSETKGEEREA